MACMHLTPMKESYSETKTKIVEEICLVVVNKTWNAEDTKASKLS